MIRTIIKIYSSRQIPLAQDVLQGLQMPYRKTTNTQHTHIKRHSNVLPHINNIDSSSHRLPSTSKLRGNFVDNFRLLVQQCPYYYHQPAPGDSLEGSEISQIPSRRQHAPEQHCCPCHLTRAPFPIAHQIASLGMPSGPHHLIVPLPCPPLPSPCLSLCPYGPQPPSTLLTTCSP
ncbi:unnamed protein product [Parajaminaea phylloscopi]